MFHHQVYPKMTIQSFSTHPYAELGLNWNRFNMLNNWKNDSNMQLVRHNPSLRKLQDPKNDLKKTFFTPAAKFGYEANVPISRVRLLSFTIGPSHLHSQRRAGPELAG